MPNSYFYKVSLSLRFRVELLYTYIYIYYYYICVYIYVTIHAYIVHTYTIYITVYRGTYVVCVSSIISKIARDANLFLEIKSVAINKTRIFCKFCSFNTVRILTLSRNR